MSGTTTWRAVLGAYEVSPPTVERLVTQLRACEVAALRFCRLLDSWRAGRPEPATAAERAAAFREVAAQASGALTELDEPLGRYLLELQPDQTEGASWYGQPGHAELVDWSPVLQRAGVRAEPPNVAQAYLELAVFVRALEGLSASAELDSAPDRSALWAGLFDLRENLWTAVGDLRLLAK